jgi:ribonuclease T1
MKKHFLYLCVFLLFAIGCGSKPNEQQYAKRQKPSAEQQYDDSAAQKNANSSKNVPQKVYEVLRYVRANGEAMPNYVGGRNFQNREKRLPIKDDSGRKLRYQEWDVNPKVRGQNRGAERLVTSPEKAYYTNDHYQTFIEIKEK